MRACTSPTRPARDVTIQLARVIGSSIARIADAEATAFLQNIAVPLAEEGNELAITQAHVQLASLNPFWRRHSISVIAITARRRCGVSRLIRGQGHRLAVGFADLVGLPPCANSSRRATWRPQSAI